MRTVLLALLLTASLGAPVALAEDRTPITARLPAGAIAYIEIDGLGARSEEFLGSEFFAALRDHPKMQVFLKSPEGQKLVFGQGMMQGMIGLDVRGLLSEVGKGRIAAAAYGSMENIVVLLEMDQAVSTRIVNGLEFMTGEKRNELLPAGANGPALFKLGDVFVSIQDGLTMICSSEQLARRVRSNDGGALSASEDLAAARRLIGGRPLLFGMVDLRPLHSAMRSKGKPKNFGEALIFGAVPHALQTSDWAAFSFDVQVNKERCTFAIDACVPQQGERPAALEQSFGGQLGDLPFALPDQTIGVLRFKRSLSAAWGHQDALVDESAIPDLVKFESTFQTLTGLAFAEEVLPKLGDEITFLAARREWSDPASTPEIQLPHLAILWPVKADERLRQSVDIAFQQIFTLIGFEQSEMSRKFMVMRETHRDVKFMTASYPMPVSDEAQSDGTKNGSAREKLPIRYNFTPSATIVGDHYVLASSKEMLRTLIEKQEGSSNELRGKNVGVALRAVPITAMLHQNRSALVAQRMLQEGEDKKAAEQSVALILEALRYVQGFSATLEDVRSVQRLQVRLDLEIPVSGGSTK